MKKIQYLILFLNLILSVTIFSQSNIGFGISASLGKDIKKTNIYDIEYKYDTDGIDGGIILKYPQKINLNIIFQLRKFELETGIGTSKRNLVYYYQSRNKYFNLKSNYQLLNIPMIIKLKYPVFRKFDLLFISGIEYSFSNIKKRSFNFDDGYFDSYNPQKEIIFNSGNRNQLLEQYNNGIALNWILGIGLDHILEKVNSKISFSMESVNAFYKFLRGSRSSPIYFALWGYDIINDKKVLGYSPYAPVFNSIFIKLNYYIYLN